MTQLSRSNTTVRLCHRAVNVRRDLMCSMAHLFSRNYLLPAGIIASTFPYGPKSVNHSGMAL
jgi:hypothetical protein